MSDDNKPVLGGIAFGPVSGLLGMRVRKSEAIPADMVLMVRNGETFQRFMMGVNTLADQEREIERLRASLAAAEQARDAALRERDEQVAARDGMQSAFNGERERMRAALDAALQRAEEALGLLRRFHAAVDADLDNAKEGRWTKERGELLSVLVEVDNALSSTPDKKEPTP